MFQVVNVSSYPSLDKSVQSKNFLTIINNNIKKLYYYYFLSFSILDEMLVHILLNIKISQFLAII